MIRAPIIRFSGAVIVLMALTGFVAAQSAQSADNPVDLTGDEMLARMESALYPESFFMRTTMETHSPDRRDTTITMQSYHKEGVGTFIEVLAPARSRGMRFLQKEESLWLYNPRSGGRRAIRLSPRESFQGSVFSNNDVGDPTYTDDYSAAYRESVTLDHPSLGPVKTYVIEAAPKHQEAAYGRIVAWIRTSDAAPVQMELYAQSGLLFKRMTLSQFTHLAGRQRPAVMRMDSMIQENTYSVVTIEAMETRNNLADRMFTQANLTR